MVREAYSMKQLCKPRVEYILPACPNHKIQSPPPQELDDIDMINKTTFTALSPILLLLTLIPGGIKAAFE